MADVHQIFEDCSYRLTEKNSLALIDEKIFSMELNRNFDGQSSWGNRQAAHNAHIAHTKARIRTALGQTVLELPRFFAGKEHSHFSRMYGRESYFVPHTLEIVVTEKFSKWVSRLGGSTRLGYFSNSNEYECLPSLSEIREFIRAALEDVVTSGLKADDAFRAKLEYIKRVNPKSGFSMDIKDIEAHVREVIRLYIEVAKELHALPIDSFRLFSHE